MQQQRGRRAGGWRWSWPLARHAAGAALALSAGCVRGAPTAPPLFELLSPEATGVRFENTLPEKPDFNILNYLYYYNGGGVAVGDVDGDGLPDLYFTSSLGPNRLYRNKGNFQFEDVTDRAGVRGGGGWTTGATMADVNGDGRVDIYVSGVDYLTMHGRNILYVNNGDGTFSDRTREYGLEHVGYSTQALFFDYDGDGDLDMYLLNHSTHTERGVSSSPQREVRHPRAGDKLFRNDGTRPGGTRFTDVSEQAHIYGGVEGYGLGVVASDFDMDGCPDLFVSNDFQENDFVYHNNCDGTFTESIAKAMPHTSRFSMGVDAADFNNDGRPDLVVVDMLPEREDVLKTSANAESFVVHDLKIEAGYHPQYARNTLELNRGEGKFSDVGYLAGVYASDWSWSALFADLDNDGRKDLFITSGIYRRPNDLDYISYIANDEVQASLARGITKENLALLQKMPSVPLPNHAYHNNGDLTFTDMAKAWGLGQPGFSNGAAYVDLDNDGALDLVVNRVNAPAAVYRNHTRELTGRHWLAVQLKGAGRNSQGIGAKVFVRQGAATQLVEQMPTRGFQSSVDQRLHFGLGGGRLAPIDSLIVVWPDRRFQVLTNVAPDRLITLSQDDAGGRWEFRHRTAPTLLTDVTEGAAPGVRHVENRFYDYNREPLMPHLLSTEGPALAAADVNGDGLDDVYVGGGKWQPGRILLQRRDGSFAPSAQPSIAADSLAEDVDAAFLDANGDGNADLYVVSAGNEFTEGAPALQDRLYLGDGRGHFRKDPAALPDLAQNGSCVVVGDYDGDGRPDLFVGSRVVTGKYGLAPRSHLLHNDGNGRFSDVTARVAPALAQAGMVTSAGWADYDGDGKLDLVVTGEWMPVRVFHQEGGRFVERTSEAGLGGSEGWWSSVTVADVNGDGRADLVLGNLGLNSYLKASAKEPARLYVGDFFDTGTLKQILTFYKNGTSYPVSGRDELVKLMPQLRSRYTSYKAFGASRIEEILPAAELSKATVLEAHTFASAVAINRGGRFELVPLPAEAQFAPIRCAIASDFDGDGKDDLLVAGNFFGVTPMYGRYDASRGLLLRGRGDGRFDPVEMDESGVAIEGQVRHLALVREAGGARAVIAARNDDDLRVLRVGGGRAPRLAGRD